MKRFISGLLSGLMLAGTVAFAASYMADPATFQVLVNGKEFVSDPPALVVEGRTYLPLRAMGDALGVPVDWNEELHRVEVGEPPEEPKKAYKENAQIVDFGDYCGDVPYIDLVYKEDYTEYIYAYKDAAKDKVTDYVLSYKDKGYTVDQEGTAEWWIYNDDFSVNFLVKIGRAYTNSLDFHVMIVIPR